MGRVCVRARVLGCTWIIKWRCDIASLSFPFWAAARRGPALPEDLAMAARAGLRGCGAAARPAPARRLRGCGAEAACLRRPPWLPGDVLQNESAAALSRLIKMKMARHMSGRNWSSAPLPVWQACSI